MRTAPVTITLIPAIPARKGIGACPLADATGACGSLGVLGIAGIPGSLVSSPGIASGSGDFVNTDSCDGRYVLLRIVMAKSENSGLSAR